MVVEERAKFCLKLWVVSVVLLKKKEEGQRY